MAFIIKFVKGVRKHWKKSTFATVAVGYGINYTKEYYEIQQLMRDYCLEAKKIGDEPISANENLKKVTVILNPNANRRKATKLFEKYCAPILNLAGLIVEVVQTQSEGHARDLIDEIQETDAIVIAGGDGTVSEVITGLLRRTNEAEPCPIGVLPVGRTNTFASFLFPGGEHLKNVKPLADAALAVAKEKLTAVNVMRIELIADEETFSSKKPIYGVAGLEWGAFRDAHQKRDKYWYFGPLRNYVTYVFNGYKDNLTWKCKANISYSPPCEGCLNCHSPLPVQKQKWWNIFSPARKPIPSQALQVNEECKNVQEKEILTTNLSVSVNNEFPPKLELRLEPETVSYLDFVTEGWKSERGFTRQTSEVINLRQLEMMPKDISSTWFSIDKEDYEVKPVRITILPKAIKVFCK